MLRQCCGETCHFPGARRANTGALSALPGAPVSIIISQSTETGSKRPEFGAGRADPGSFVAYPLFLTGFRGRTKSGTVMKRKEKGIFLLKFPANGDKIVLMKKIPE